MTFTLLDVILLLAVFGFSLFGLWFGLIHTLGTLIGTVIGAAIAGQLYAFVPGELASILSFVGITFAVARLVGMGTALIEKIFHIISILPFLKTINRLGGGIFGFVEGVLFVGIVLIVASRYNLGPWFTNAMTQSKVAPPLVDAAKILLPLLPVALKQLQSWIPWVKF